MKFFALGYLLLWFTNGYAQTNKYECACTKIGIDPKWADSNKVSCYSIPVLRDVRNKTAGTFQIAVLMAASLGKVSQEPLLYLHGGPGIATLENVPRYVKSTTWNLLRQQRPIVFFDYRGTGLSEPDLCPGMADSLAASAVKNLSPEKMVSYKTRLYSECRTQHLAEGIDVSTFNSFQSAEDAEAVRNALRIDRWNVYGVSHGTTVALNLLRNHGKQIDGMILDSPFPPNAPWVDFVRPFDTSFKMLEQKIAEDPMVSSHFPFIRKDFVQAVERLNKMPLQVPVQTTESTIPFDGNDFAWSIWSALLDPASIRFVPLVIKEVAQGNDSVLSKWVVSFSDPNAYGKFSELQSKAVLCYEAKPQTEKDSKASLQAAYPDFASFNIDFEGELCNAWQPRSADKMHFAPVESDVPVLIFSGEYDPVCPPLFGELTARTLSHSTFITVPAASHAAIHADDCIRGIAAKFLSDPRKKLSIDCVNERADIQFITDNLQEALSKIK